MARLLWVVLSLSVVTSIDYRNKELEADLAIFSEIPEVVKDLLFRVISSNERYEIFSSSDSIERALNLKKGEPVTVKIDGEREQCGNYRYTRQIQNERGTYFGVQLEVRFFYKLHFNLRLWLNDNTMFYKTLIEQKLQRDNCSFT